jgi:hypothetical protein
MNQDPHEPYLISTPSGRFFWCQWVGGVDYRRLSADFDSIEQAKRWFKETYSK